MHTKEKKKTFISTKQEQKLGAGRGPSAKPAAFEREGPFLLCAQRPRSVRLSLQNPPNSFSQYPT